MNTENTSSATQVDPIVMRPSAGWYNVGGPCYDNANYGGLRIHADGYCRLPLTGRFVSGNQWPESKNLNLFVRVCGGNRLRGIMVWAMNLVENGYDSN